MSTESSVTLRQSLESLVVHGYTVIAGSPANTESGTAVVAERIGPIMPSKSKTGLTRSVVIVSCFLHIVLYKGCWELGSGSDQEFSDISYSNVGIEPHTDGTYLMQPPGFVNPQSIQNAHS